jgi:hypothetical protein
MREENFDHLTMKIENMLKGWRARHLSLLGKILIYKTFGLSQVIYVLSVIRLNNNQYKKIDIMFNNFIWGRELGASGGGFGMIQYDKILEGIHCRQLAKMYDTAFSHPIKSIIIKNDVHFATGKSLTTLADEISINANKSMTTAIIKHVKKLSNQQIVDDIVLTDILGATDICIAIKPRWIHSIEATRLIHTLGCSNIKNIIDRGRVAIRLSKKIIKAFYLRIIKALWQSNKQCEEIQSEKFVLLNGTYKNIHMVTSKEFRELIRGQIGLTQPKLPIDLNVEDDYDRYAIKNYFSKIKRMANTRHKNTLLRIWNGDCLSYSRLIHLRVVDTNRCPNCNMVDTPLHLLVECNVAVQTWTRLMEKIPKNSHIPIFEYAIGLYDSTVEMSIKAEILKMLMHNRSMDAEALHRRLKNYFLTINPKHPKIRLIFG